MSILTSATWLTASALNTVFDHFMQYHPETADIETSSDDYASRFDSRAGRWMLSVQEQIVTGWMRDIGATTVLDIGGGHGQLAMPLAREGFDVTVLGSDASCAHRLAPYIEDRRLTFKTGDPVAPPFDEKSFDAVISFRLLPHCKDWERLISELCRTARRAVIVDYPTSQSINALTGLLFGAKKKIEKNTRPYTLFGHRQIRACFARNEFERTGTFNQFFWPMVLHRLINRPAVSRAMEGVARATGLTAMMGSPTIARFTRAKVSGVECRVPEKERTP